MYERADAMNCDCQVQADKKTTKQKIKVRDKDIRWIGIDYGQWDE